MAQKGSLIDRMRANPRKDWTIEDVRRLCDGAGLSLKPPTGGSHYKVTSERLAYLLTIPAHRPIKPIYIRMLLNYADAHNAAQDDQTNGS